MRLCSVVLGFALLGCSFDPAGSSPPASGDASGSMSDAAAGSDAASNPDGGGQVVPPHLLFSEVKTHPLDLEFIEIFNPGCEAVELSSYHVADVPDYALVPSWTGGAPVLANQDVVLRFPDGATLASGEVAVIAREEATFLAGFGFLPDYSIRAATVSEQMVFVARGTSESMELRNEGEALILVRWDGASDLVTDVDVVVPGDAPIDGQGIVGKQDVAPGGVDGPDEDGVATQYASDAATLPAMTVRDAGTSATVGAYQRIRFEGPAEVAIGGNGIEGHDETSEDTRETWEQDVGTLPTPGQVPDSLRAPCVGPG